MLLIEAEATLESTAAVTLGDDAQSGARALNLVNAAGSDAAQGVNVANRDAGLAAGSERAMIEQRNEIAQSAGAPAVIGELIAPGGTVVRRLEETGTSSHATRNSVLSATVDRRVAAESVTTRFQAEVLPEFVGLFDTPVSLGGHEIALPAFAIDFSPFDVDFDFGESWVADWFDQTVDVTIDIAAVEVEGASLRLGEVTLEGNDILVSSPTLTMPELTFTFCFVARGCGGEDGGDPVTVTVGGRTFGLDPIRLTDANPLGDLGMSFGYAVAGDGTISFDSGGVEVSGHIPLDLGSLGALGFDIDIPEIGVLSGFTGSFETPVIEIPIDLDLDFPLPDLLSRSIAGEACVLVGNQETCTPLDRTVATFEERTSGSADSEIAEVAASESHALVELERTRGDLRVEQGQADIVVLRDSELADRRYRLVVISGEAQSRIRVANIVNSATAIVGSGLNLGTGRAGTRDAIGGSATSLTQTNSFNQVGGL